MHPKGILFGGILTLLLAPSQLRSAAPLRGVVRDRSGAVIAGAIVQLSLGTRLVAETKTVANGEFLLLPPPGASADDEYTILAAASGFAPAIETVKLAEAGARRLEFVLDVAPYRQSMEVQAAAPVYQSTLDLSGVRESPAKDLGEALSEIDGVWKIRKAGIANDLVVRGLQQNDINVLVDGTRTYAACPSHMDPPASHVDFVEVDHVDVSKGAFDVANAGSLGPTVDIVTKEPGMGFQIKPSLSLGSFDFFNPSVTASYGSSAFQILAGYSYRVSDPYSDGSGQAFTSYANYSATGKQQHAFDINTGWLEAYWNPSDQQQLSLRYTRQQSGLTLYPYLTMDSNYDNADRAAVHYVVRDLTPALRELRAEGYYTNVHHFMTDSERATAMMGQWTMAGDATSQSVGGHIEADLGSDFTIGTESYHRNWNLTGSMRMSGTLMTSPSIPDVNTLASGVFAIWHRPLGERLRLTAGARFDHAQMRVGDSSASTDNYYQFHDTRRTSNMDNYPSANAQLSYALASSSQLFAGVGTTGRIPDAEERYLDRGMGTSVDVGDPLLPITRNTEIDAGWSFHSGRFTFRPQVFYSWLDNFILVDNQPQINAPMGGGGMGGVSLGADPMDMTMPGGTSARSYTDVAARLRGGEASYGVMLTGTLTLNGGVSYTRGTATPVMAAGVMSTNLPEMPPLRGWSSLRYSPRWFFAELGAIAAGRQSDVDTDLMETPTAGYALLNAKVGFTHKRVSVSFSADNLLNRFYYEYLSYYRDPFASGVKVPEPGRNVFAQVRYAF